ncbi:MAG TPA: endonuclease V [Kofleriaceae bacterium]|nr:endonuclease V [Kofleriaceae bacterium]
MIGCVDVDYRDTGVTAACVGAEGWASELARIEVVVRAPGRPAAYQPGAFYERELPYLLEVLERMPPLELVIVDAYVWLGPDQPGLGKRLHDARGGIVVGVAKTRFAGAEASGGGARVSGGASQVIDVRRGDSDRPLHVTAVGMDPAAAAAHVAAMHGEFRIPTLLRRADALARGHAPLSGR